MTIFEFVISIHSLKSGLRTVAQKFGHDDQLFRSLQDLFPGSSADEKVDDMLVMTKKYHNYKKKYVLHLSFNPKEDNLSKVTFVN